ncbi:MAG: type III-B CRISPR module-associated Cmr3 family protein [Candidatus Aenigmatarchaeota archaeon]
MSIPYLITFKPIERFYFGTPQSFGESFYAISLMFPTQTTILGVLRAALLEKYKLLDLEKRKPLTDFTGLLIDEVKKLTGTANLENLFSDTDDLGKILKISPVFIVRQDEGSKCAEDFLFPVPNDVIFEYDKNEKEDNGSPKIKGLKLLEFSDVSDVKVFSRNSDIDTVFSLENKIKEYNANYLGGIDFWQSYRDYYSNKKLKYHENYLLDKIFISDSQPGIAREDRKTKEAHYYIKHDFRMHKNYSFGVIVHFTEEGLLEDREVFMGGEKSLFRMTIKKIDENAFIYNGHPVVKRFINENDFGDFDGSKDRVFIQSKLVAFSNFFSNDAKFTGIQFALINGMYIHRNIWDRNITDSYSALPYGSILYINGKLELDKPMTNFKLLKKIGFNFFISFRR